MKRPKFSLRSDMNPGRGFEAQLRAAGLSIPDGAFLRLCDAADALVELRRTPYIRKTEARRIEKRILHELSLRAVPVVGQRRPGCAVTSGHE